MVSSSTTTPLSLSLPTLLALSSLLLQPVYGENWNPRVHVQRRDYLVPRTSERLPRPLKARAATIDKPGQPTHTVSDDLILGFEVVGDSGVSGQQIFLGSDSKVSCFRRGQHFPDGR